MTTPPIVLIHGALGGAAQMLPIADALSAQGDVHCLELPGHGDTPLPDGAPFSMTTFAGALRDDIARRGWQQPLVFGYSMGGYVALLLESRSPGMLGGIVTLGTKFEWTPEIAVAAASRLDASVLRAKVPAFADQLRGRHAGAGGWERVLARTTQLLTDLGSDPLLTAPTLAAVQIPVRVGVGSRDDTVTDGEAARLAALLPHASLHVLHDVPHPIERVPASLVVDLFRDLVRDLPRS
ncbi:alpha/beta fold hydrolase [Gemmatimonas sp.]|uniref:alpha/beta fold hydrolase n=1 Tax=Gemmatimonas sp. TaxID=1962908 RepID=UPI003982DD02